MRSIGSTVMKQGGITGFAVTAALFATFALSAPSAVLTEGFFASLKGFSEVPAVFSTGIGTFRALLSEDETAIDYELAYIDMKAEVLQAHIHLGQADVNGGIVVFLCTNLEPPEGVPEPPPCPQAGTVTGSLTAADVTGGAAAQGIAAGEFEKLLAAMRAGVTYVNVHSDKFPGGEIRGQVIANP